jgi:hypothetical protein
VSQIAFSITDQSFGHYTYLLSVDELETQADAALSLPCPRLLVHLQPLHGRDDTVNLDGLMVQEVEGGVHLVDLLLRGPDLFLVEARVLRLKNACQLQN